MGATTGKVAGVYAAAVGTPTAFTDEATTANVAKTIYTITNAAKRAWSLSDAVTVKKNGTPISTGFAIHYAGGQIVFDVALASEAVTVSGKFCAVTERAGMYDWKRSSSIRDQDVTDFTAATANGCEVHAAVGLEHDTLTCSSFWQSTELQAAIGSLYYVKAFINAGTGERYECWALLVGAGADAAIGAVVESPLTFVPTGGFWYSAS